MTASGYNLTSPGGVMSYKHRAGELRGGGGEGGGGRGVEVLPMKPH